MPRYHNTDNGPKPCSTTPDRCPITKDTNEPHYNTIEKAQEHYEKKMSALYPVMTKTRKTHKYLEPLIINPPKNKDEILSKYLTSGDYMGDSKPNKYEQTFVSDFVNGEIPEEIPFNLTRYGENFMAGFRSHQAGQEVGYYAKITKKFAKKLAQEVGKDAVILDPMAGKGYFTKAMREQGIKTIGSDDKSWEKVQSDDKSIENIEALNSLNKYGNEISHVLISWAPYDSDIDHKIYTTIQEKYPHITIINIGEDSGGCTGSEKFWTEIEKRDEFEYTVEKNQFGYETVNGLSDSVTFIYPETP